jgi:hypothetical protein
LRANSKERAVLDPALATGFSIDVRPDDADEFGKVFARAFEEVDLDDINTVSIQRNDPRDRPDDTGEHP